MMDKLREFFKGLLIKWKEFSMVKRISIVVLVIAVLTALVYTSVALTTTKYEVLFSNMSTEDSGAVMTKLKDQKIPYQVKGNSILVPKEQVDEVRMNIMSSVTLTNGSKGFELFDASKFGTTDAEMKIEYQRALEGEIERTIKSFPQIDGARVHLVLPEDSVFVKDSTAAKASVTLSVKSGNKIKDDQVRAIASLISGAVKNLPKENIDIVDNNMTLLTKDLFNKNNADVSSLNAKQQTVTADYEKNLQDKIMAVLGVVYKDKVKVSVNANLDFDAVEQNSTVYDPKTVVVSEHEVKNSSGNGTGNTSNSPVDNNASNTIVTNNNTNGTTSSSDKITNYDVSKTDSKTIKAPGAVKRLTTSVVLDGNIDDNTRTVVKNLVAQSIGYDEKRGDSISIEGLPFDTSYKDNAKKELDAINKQKQQDAQTSLYKMVAEGVVAGILLLAIIVALIKRKRKNEEGSFGENGIDFIIDDDRIAAKEIQNFNPINLDVQNEKSHIESEIKKYASEKPEQVADIVKSWLAEDER